MRNRLVQAARRRSLLVAFSLALGSVSVAHASLARIAKDSATYEGGYGVAAFNEADSVAYFASSTTISGASVISEYSLVNGSGGTFAYLGYSPYAITGVANYTAGGFDATTGFGYFATSDTSAAIVRIPLTAAAIATASISSTTLDTTASSVGTAVLDPSAGYGYFGTATSPALVLKVQLSDLAIVSTITLPSTLSYLDASAIDTGNGYAYFASSTTPGAVAKIRLSNFTLNNTLTLSGGIGPVASAVIDTAASRLYLGTHERPGKVVEVRLSDFSQVQSLTLKSGENDLTAAGIDTSRRFAYFGTNTSSGIVVPIRLASFTERESLTLEAGENSLRSAVVDAANGYAYFGTYTSSGQVVQVDILAGVPEIYTQPNSVEVHVGDTAGFSITADGRSLTYQWKVNGVDVVGATGSTYSRTVTQDDDGASIQCVVTDAAGSTGSSVVSITIIPTVRAYPNPWRADRYAGTSITFDGLLSNATVKIFNLAAHWVKTLAPPVSGATSWDLTNDAGETVASGYYFYVATNGNSRQTVRGKLAVIR